MQNSIETRGNLCTELLTELGPPVSEHTWRNIKSETFPFPFNSK